PASAATCLIVTRRCAIFCPIVLRLPTVPFRRRPVKSLRRREGDRYWSVTPTRCVVTPGTADPWSRVAGHDGHSGGGPDRVASVRPRGDRRREDLWRSCPPSARPGWSDRDPRRALRDLARRSAAPGALSCVSSGVRHRWFGTQRAGHG